MDAGLALEKRHTVLTRKAVGALPGDNAVEPRACSGVSPEGPRATPGLRSWRDRSDCAVSSHFSVGKKAQGWTNRSLQTPGRARIVAPASLTASGGPVKGSSVTAIVTSP